MNILIGPFTQIVTLRDLPERGPIKDEQLEIIEQGGVWIQNGIIKEVNRFDILAEKAGSNCEVQEIYHAAVLLPGFIDSHTHICFGGSRAGDYALRVAGATYQEILKAGGGIHDSVAKTRAASESELVRGIMQRAHRHLLEGVTTIEVKSGYGLNAEQELKMLRAIKTAADSLDAELIPTCLAAHVKPKDFQSTEEYVAYCVNEIFPKLKEEKLAERVDVFVEDEAFPAEVARKYLQAAKEEGFELTIHADQFSKQGSPLAVELGALSADHLEASSEKEIELLAKSNTVATVLPGASLGLGMHYAPARKLLDGGAILAIASDWNPGSAPMGDLLTQAALLGAAEKLSMSETFAGITYRAAKALNLADRGKIETNFLADMVSYPTQDYREILYQQGKLKPTMVWKKGKLVK